MNPNAEEIERTEVPPDFAQAFQRLALSDEALPHSPNALIRSNGR